jgi:hypothetical protein
VRSAWEDCQASRDRNAIYGYLSAVFDLVMWWAAEGRAVSRARWALQLHGLDLPTTDEPFAAIIRCTADSAKVDKRTRSKWSRVMRYVDRVQIAFRAACSLHSAQRWDQRVCVAVCSMPRATQGLSSSTFTA